MFAHESRMAFFCETNRLYETTSAKPIRTTIPSITSKTATIGSFLSSRILLRLGVERIHHLRDVVDEGLHHADERHHVHDLQLLVRGHDPVTGHLEREPYRGSEQPLDHPGVDEV